MELSLLERCIKEDAEVCRCFDRAKMREYQCGESDRAKEIIGALLEQAKGIKTLGPKGGYQSEASASQKTLLSVAHNLCEKHLGHSFTLWHNNNGWKAEDATV